jgi:hypothetical protein
VETWGPVVALNVLSRTLSFFMMMCFLHYLVRLTGLNGPVVKRLRDVWVAIVFLSGWVWLMWLEGAIDFLPGVSLQRVCTPFSFIPHGVLCVTLVRLWLVVNPKLREGARAADRSTP